MASGMNVLVISYWPLADVLTQAAVLPHLRLLQTLAKVEHIVLVTIEREDTERIMADLLLPSKKVKHVPLQSRNYKSLLLNKINDFILFPKQLLKIVKQEQINAIVASGTLAGTLALKVWDNTKLPFYVLYEPHADYMLDSNVWPKYDFRYIFQKKWEVEQIRAAAGLLVVSQNYADYLIQAELVNEAKVRVFRNPVNVMDFRFQEQDRNLIREQLNWKNATVGVFSGKYGGLYYNDEAFLIYQKCFELIPNFRLIILSPQPEQAITNQLVKHGIDLEKVYIASVQHHQVPKYLSAADFAFATIKSYPSAKYCSPVKIGEYWANGLPVLLTEGVGDDSDIIKAEGGGALFNLTQTGSLEQAILQVKTIVQNPMHRQEIPQLAAKYRSLDKVREAYEFFFNQQHKL